MDWINFDSRFDIEPRLFKAKAHSPGTCKQVNGYWALIHLNIVFM